MCSSVACRFTRRRKISGRKCFASTRKPSYLSTKTTPGRNREVVDADTASTLQESDLTGRRIEDRPYASRVCLRRDLCHYRPDRSSQNNHPLTLIFYPPPESISPQRAWINVIPASATVSVRKIRGPRFTPINPASTASSRSWALNPPSGPESK